MDPIMAVRTTPVNHKELIGTSRDRLVSALHMAALAQPEVVGLQQFVVVGPVRRMTVVAILLYGGMLPENGTAKFRMASVTGIIHRISHEHRGSLASMRIVATRARHLALFDRVG
jgi:hypothetical protein